ncbi:MAG: hypothetical protein JWP88_1562 [Flaviaesturariibacter sp.]|nr:hypothetical protein [Flaviaesturariibacter sp.]
MKTIIAGCCLLLSSIINAQDVTGLYTGTLYNDTTRMHQSYEIALSEYKGKVTGYSYTTFVLNDQYYYLIRRVKAAKRNGKLLIEDDKIIANNLSQPPDKGVKRLTVIPLEGIDSVTTLNGKWQTNRTRTFYSISGSMDLKRDNDSSHSALIAHLKELNLIAGEAAVAEVKVKTSPTEQKIKIEPKKETAGKPLPPPATPYTQRQNKTVQSITVTTDSVEISLYDNGVVDGDIVSVYLNGVVVMSNTKLKEQASKLMVALPAGIVDHELKLVAENLGVLPPNTGLLIIRDGENKHTVHFSADLQTNASIILRKRN